MILILFITTFILSLFCIFTVKKIAYKNNLTNSQQTDRWNDSNIALHGGIGFIPVFLVSSIILLWFQLDGDFRPILLIDSNSEHSILFGILAGALLMFVVGIIDDAINLNSMNKLFFQSISASIFLVFTDVIFIHNHPILNIFITYFWFIGIINAFNFLDNMDGLASGVVIVSLLAAIYFITNSSLGFDSLSCSIIFILISCVGAFWCFNFPPATIFMGDSGSLSLGFLVAAFVAPSPLNDYFLPINNNSYPLYIGTLISFSIAIVPIFDTGFVTITRLWEARKISQGGKDHTSHRLMNFGLNERKVIAFFYIYAFIGVVIAILISKYPIFWLPLFIFLLLIISLLGVYIGRIKTTRNATQISNNFPLNNQIIEAVMDIGLVTVCFYTSYIIRFGGSIADDLIQIINSSLPIIIGSSLISFQFFGIYKKKGVQISLVDYKSFLQASIGSVILSVAFVTLFLQFPDGNSRGVFLIFGLLLFPIMFISRFSLNILDRFLLKLIKINTKH